jgi:uncharacterized protein YgbK (DUF1537 family)
LHVTDSYAADQINFNLLSGGQITQIKKWLDVHGHPEISLMNLSRHSNRHLDAWIRTYLHYQASGAALANLLRDAPPDEIAVTSVKHGMVIIGTLIADAQRPVDKDDNRSVLERVGDVKFLERLLDRQARYAVALSHTEKARQQNALAARKMALQELQLAQKNKDFIGAAEAAWEQMLPELSAASRADVEAMLARRRQSAPAPTPGPRSRKALK